MVGAAAIVAFNWTKVELKQRFMPIFSDLLNAFNWTKVELKQGSNGVLGNY